VSPKDLAWDLAGMVAATLVLRRTRWADANSRGSRHPTLYSSSTCGSSFRSLQVRS